MESRLKGPLLTAASSWAVGIAAAGGLLAVGVGAAGMIGLHLQDAPLVAPRPGYAPMQYLTALCLLLCGAGLVAAVFRLPRMFAVALGGFVGAVGLLLSIEYLTGAKLGFDLLLPHLPVLAGQTSLRPSPPTAVCFLLCGLAIPMLGSRVSAAFRRPAIWILGSLVLSLCVMALCGYLTGLSGMYVWGDFIGMSIRAAAGLGCLGIGLLATQWTDGKSVLGDPWLPAPVAVGTVAAALILWQALLSDRYNALRAESAIIAQHLQADAVVQMEGSLNVLERMTRRWERRGGIPYEEWKDDAATYLRDEIFLAAVEWVDPSLRVRWVVPESPTPIEGPDLSRETRWPAGEMLGRAQGDRAMILSPTMTLAQGGRGFIAYHPLFPEEAFDGFLAFVFRLDALLESLLHDPGYGNYAIAVFEGGERIHGPPLPESEAESFSAESVADLHGHRWRFVVWPTASVVSVSGSRLPHVVLLLGLLFAAALTIAVRAVQQVMRNTRALREANRNLEQEIEARAEVGARLRESEERQRVVLDSATGVAVISADTTGRIQYFSKGAERLLGYSQEEMVGKATPAIFHLPEEIAARAAELTLELGRPVEGFDVFVSLPRLNGSERREWTYVCKDGRHRTVDLMVTVLDDAAGGITGFLSTAIDITERKEMEQALRDTLRAKETAQALLEAAGRIARLGHWEIPMDGGALFWSDITYAIHEVPPGTPVSQEEGIAFYHAEDRDAIESHIQRSLETGGIFDFEARLITARGREIWVHTRGEPVRNASGRVVVLRGVIQDVDDRHRAAELLEQRNRELEAARAQAEAHARAKAEFLANMSHEIRTPLNAVVGMSDLLMDAELPPHERELAETIRTSGDVLLSLINDILDFSKIESGQLDLERTPVHLRECVESALDLVAGPAAKKKLDLVYWIDPSVPPAILGDLTRFRQIVVNLVANAIKFTSEGEVFVRISRQLRDGDGDMLHVAVRDSGIGIPADRMDRLFRAFSQVDASTTRRFGGTGLGLAISHRLVEMMNGRIWVESAVGKGSTFQFEVPLQAAEVSMPAAFGRRGMRSLEGMRVLIVDDNATNRWILQMQAESWGMLPVLAEDPDRGLEHVRAGEAFDIALLDVRLPGMNGYELAAEIRRHRSKENLPIVLLTSVGEPGRNLDELGIAGVLSKPVKTTPLFNVLCRILGESRDAGSATAVKEEKRMGADYPLRILVAEDNTVNQRVADLLLQRLGYRATIVANGLEVLTALGSAKFDAILLDIQMPEMDGFETAREICRRMPADARPWMIALTAHAIEGDRDECLAAGMDDYLSKPIRSESLASELRKAFHRVRG